MWKTINEKFKALIKETENDTGRWKDSPYSWVDRINFVKMSSYQKQRTYSM